MVGGLARVAAVLDRIASDVEDLARAIRSGELTTAAVLPGHGRPSGYRRGETGQQLACTGNPFRGR